MLRKTAQKAFAAGDAARRAPDPAPAEACRAAAVDRLFRDLLESLEQSAREFVERAEERAALEVSRPHPTTEGVEFVVEGPGGRFHWTNTLRGFLIVKWTSPSARGEELLSVQRHGGSYRPIQKILPSASRGGRGGFRFTSVPELRREYLRRALGK